MSLAALFFLAVGLSMDAFAVSVCKGLAMGTVTAPNSLVVGLWFGSFQALMPCIGYLLGINFADRIKTVDHWIAFFLLGAIGVNMVREALKGDGECASASLAFGEMLILAVATSIDALAAGLTFAFLKVNVIAAVSFIGVTTFILSAAGVKVGGVFGNRYQSKAELAGGVILIFIGTKTLLEHIGIL